MYLVSVTGIINRGGGYRHLFGIYERDKKTEALCRGAQLCHAQSL